MFLQSNYGCCFPHAEGGVVKEGGTLTSRECTGRDTTMREFEEPVIWPLEPDMGPRDPAEGPGPMCGVYQVHR